LRCIHDEVGPPGEASRSRGAAQINSAPERAATEEKVKFAIKRN